jgi:hypothetical protein
MLLTAMDFNVLDGRGLWKQAIQDLLIATVQNPRKLVGCLCQTNPELTDRCAELLR